MAKKVKELPYNLEAEKAVLGSCILSNEALYAAMSSLEREDYYEIKHKTIYDAIRSLMDRKKPVDALTLAEELNSMKELENIGGVNYLAELTDSMISLSNLQFHIDIISDLSVLRKMLQTIRDIDRKYLEEDIDNPNDFILESEAKFKDSVAKRHISSFLDSKTVVARVEEQLEAQQGMDTVGDVTGLDTGYPRINFYTQGFQRGELTIVAARPSVGKTALSMNFAYQVAQRNNCPVAVFSLEMAAEQLMKRLIASVSCVSLKKIATGKFEGSERAKIASALNELSNTPIFIDDTPGIKLMDIIAKSRKLQAAHPDLGLIVIDYLGLVQLGGSGRGGADSRQEEVRKISLALKGLAKDLKVPVIVVSQLSRDVEKRDTKRPMLSDLRDSGSIEQDADVVMLLYRQDYYKETDKSLGEKKGGKLSSADKFELAKEQKEKDLGSAMPGSASYVEVNIAKNRNGAVGKVGLFFFKEFGKFDSPSEEWEKAMLEITAGNDD